MSKLGKKYKKPLILPLLGLVFALLFSLLTPFFTTPAQAVDDPAQPTITTPDSTTELTPDSINTQTPDTTAPLTDPGTASAATESAENQSATDPADNPSTQETPENQTTTETTASPQSDDLSAAEDTCSTQAGALAWFICPASGFFANAVDGIYGIISNLLTVHPIINDTESSIYKVWEYVRDITNIVFIIFMVIVIYMQITGLGASKYNYTIKRALPRLVISAIVVNLSFIISALAVDLSNILGHSLIDFFESIRNATASTVPSMTWTELITALTVGGGAVFLVAELSGGASQIIYIVIVALLCALIAVIIGLVVIAMRQALIYLLIMIAPLAFVTSLLPNTEQYFTLWKKMFSQMLIFFPMFSILFGASELAGWVVMGFGGIYIVLGMAIQIVPLILSISLLKMSGTVLGRFSTGLTKLTNPADAAIRGWGASKRDVRRAEKLSRDMANHGDRLNPFSIGSWNAHRGYERIKNAERIKKAEGNIGNLGVENINALKTGRRIIARDHLGRPVYSSHPVKSNPWMRREAESRDIENRTKGSTLAADNFHSTLGTHLKVNHINDHVLSEHASNQIRNYETIRTAQTAAINNARSDERFYLEQVRKAAELNKEGEVVNPDAYDRLIVQGAGADLYDTNPNIRNAAITSVVANAYESYEAQRQATIKRNQIYFSRIKTADLMQEFTKAMDNKSTDDIVAAGNVLAFRGDVDFIWKELRTHFDLGDYAQLGTDFTNNIASFAMGLKDQSDVIGRFGKFLNMQTAAYTIPKYDEDGNLVTRAENVTAKEYFTGVDTEGHKIKRYAINLIPGTSLKKAERNAFDIHMDSMDAYMSPEDYGGDVAATIAARENYVKQQMSNIISGTLSYSSKSEQIFNAIKFITGYETLDGSHYNITKDKTGVIIDEDGKSQYYDDITEMFLSKHSDVSKVANMNGDVVTACLKRFQTQAYQEPDIPAGATDEQKAALRAAAEAKAEDAAYARFQKIFRDNNVLQNIEKSNNRNAIANMHENMRKALGLDPRKPKASTT